MNVIRLITTEGCDGCRIAKNLIAKAVLMSEIRNITFEWIDCQDENYKDFIKEYGITDFPTIVFIKDMMVQSIHIGTMAVPQLLYQIKLWFN